MKLRISHIIVQPVLVIDDGDELTPGPEVQPQAVPLSRLAGIAATLPAEFELLQQQLETEQETP